MHGLVAETVPLMQRIRRSAWVLVVPVALAACDGGATDPVKVQTPDAPVPADGEAATPLHVLPFGGSDLRVLSSGGGLVAVSFSDSSDVQRDSVAEFDVERETWTVLGEVPALRQAAISASADAITMVGLQCGDGDCDPAMAIAVLVRRADMTIATIELTDEPIPRDDFSASMIGRVGPSVFVDLHAGPRQSILRIEDSGDVKDIPRHPTWPTYAQCLFDGELVAIAAEEVPSSEPADLEASEFFDPTTSTMWAFDLDGSTWRELAFDHASVIKGGAGDLILHCGDNEVVVLSSNATYRVDQTRVAVSDPPPRTGEGPWPPRDWTVDDSGTIAVVQPDQVLTQARNGEWIVRLVIKRSVGLPRRHVPLSLAGDFVILCHVPGSPSTILRLDNPRVDR